MMHVDTKTVQNVQQASEVFEEYADTIRTTIAVHVNDKSTIDDIFNDFFLSLVQKPIPRGVKNVRAYVSRAVKNDVIDLALQTKSYHLRNRKYSQMHTGRFKSPTSSDLAIHAEDIRQLFDIVEKQLVHHEAEAIIQKYRHGRDTGEAAKALGINKRSFSHYLCTSLRKLHRFFSKNDHNKTIDISV